MNPVVILDTETGGLGLDNPIWEIAVLRIDENGERSQVWQVKHSQTNIDLPDKLLFDYMNRYQEANALGVSSTVALLNQWLRPNDSGKAVIMGSAVDFDMYRIQHQFGMKQIWHHHLVDVPTWAYGKLHKQGEKDEMRFPPDLSSAARAFGIDVENNRHQAMGDVRITYQLLDKLI